MVLLKELVIAHYQALRITEVFENQVDASSVTIRPNPGYVRIRNSVSMYGHLVHCGLHMEPDTSMKPTDVHGWEQ